MNTRQIEKGFSIIEVVLVLAIAGLIFLMVFVALPALQAGQRDTARKNDVSMVASSYTNFINNNRGTTPTNAQLRTALGGTNDGGPFKELSGNSENVSVNEFDSTPRVADEGIIRIYQRAKCGPVSANGSISLTAGTARQFVVTTRLEGSSATGYCLDS
jgi:prepilin-type N-terminal cleavage/methylation domain-containing protein